VGDRALPDAVAADSGRGTVLVVDDEELNRKLLRQWLEPTYDVIEAASGPAALAALEQHAVDTVLLDVLMPEMDGFETCRVIRERYPSTALPIVMLTALRDQDSRNRGLATGADDFLSKPVDRRELELRVRGTVRQSLQQRQIDKQIHDLAALRELQNDLFTLILHDMRNPLGAMMGLLDLTSPEHPEELPELLTNLRLCAGSLNELIEEVLIVRQLEVRRLPIQRVRESVADCARRAMESTTEAAVAANAEVHLQAEGDVLLNVDSKLVRRAIATLLHNAIDNSPRDGRVDVRVTARDHDVLVEVSDRGASVPDRLKGMIFSKFNAGEVSRSANRRGLGMGLHLVHLVAEAHNGEANVVDRQDGGSTFRLLLRATTEGAP
jgi:two-component system sensor histidine kinase/response regulator